MEVDAPTDLVAAAKLVASTVGKDVYVSLKKRGGTLKGRKTYWCLAFEQDGFDSRYVVKPEGDVKICGMWT